MYSIEPMTILMYLLIALGLYFLVAPEDFVLKYAPKFISDLDKTTHVIIGVACLGGAYFLYRKKIQNEWTGRFEAAPPNYDSTEMTPSL